DLLLGPLHPAAVAPLVRLLARTGSPRASVVARIVVEDATDPDVVAACIHALGRLRDPRDAALIARMRHHYDPALRAELARARGRTGGPSDVESLAAMLDDPRPGVRRAA